MKKMMLAAMLAAVAGAASAQGYAGAVAGLTKLNSDCPVGWSCDDSDTGFKLYGGYEVAPQISVEVGYVDFGKSEITRVGQRGTLKATAFTIGGAFRAKFHEDWTGVARLGLAAMKVKREENSPIFVGGNRSESNAKLYAGLGIEYALGQDFKITGSLDLTNAEIDGDSGSVYLIGIGAQMGF